MSRRLFSIMFWVLEWLIMACIIILESPIIVKSWILSFFAWCSPCQRAKASALLLDSIPRPIVKRVVVASVRFSIIPPPPVRPGFPFEGPSKKRIGVFISLFQLVKSFLLFLISQSSLTGSLAFRASRPCILNWLS